MPLLMCVGVSVFFYMCGLAFRSPKRGHSHINSLSLSDPFVKVYLLQDGRKISKKKTSTKRDDTNPIFNEAMIFSVPSLVLQVRRRVWGLGPKHASNEESEFRSREKIRKIKLDN